MGYCLGCGRSSLDMRGGMCRQCRADAARKHPDTVKREHKVDACLYKWHSRPGHLGWKGKR